MPKHVQLTDGTTTTDNAIPRWDDATGSFVKNSGYTISDADDITAPNATYAGGYATGGILKNIDSIRIDQDYTQTVLPASDSLIGSQVNLSWNATIDQTDGVLGPTIQPGFFGPRGSFEIEGALEFKVSTSGYKPGPIGYANQLLIKNAPGYTINLTPNWNFMNAPYVQADTNTLTLTHTDTSKGGTGFVDNQIFTTTNGGIIDGTTNDFWTHSFLSLSYVTADVSLAGRYGFKYEELNYAHPYHGGAAVPEVPVGAVGTQIAFEVPYLYKATKNVGIRNASNYIKPPRTITVASASTTIPLESTLMYLDNTSGGTVILTTTPTIPNGQEEGQQVTIVNKSADPVALAGEATLPGSNIAETQYLPQNVGVTLIYVNGSWVEASNPTARGFVSGPTIATDNAFARFDGTTGKVIQNGAATLSDAGTINVPVGQGYQIAGTDITSVAQNLSNKTLITPTIASFTNATHTHQNAAGGGTLDHGLALTGLTDDDHTQYALLAGRSGGQTLYGGTAGADHLNLYPNSASYDSDNTGRIKALERLDFGRTFTIDANNTGFFTEWHFTQITNSGTKTVGATGNLGDYVMLQDTSTISFAAQQAFSSITLFDAANVIEQTASTAKTDNTTHHRGFFSRLTYAPSISAAVTVTGALMGGYFSAPTVAIKAGSHGSAAVVMPEMYGFRSSGGVAAQSTVTTWRHFEVLNIAPSGGGAITTQIGLDVPALTGGTSDIGIRLAKSDTYTLQLSDTGGTAAGGITFGTDTNLYRSAANTLKTDDAFDAASYAVGGAAGATGTFTTVDLKTVTVTNGIIVSIV